MTFNNDVDLGGLFQKIYFWITGKQSDGFTVLEISYSIGIGLGILFFFNHFGKLKFTDDPTPMQIQMRTYEDDVNNTLIEDAGRFQNQSEKS
jgi:stage V sporulation protein AA